MSAEQAVLPRLCRDLVVVPDTNAVLIEGGARRHTLRGSGAALLTRLIPLLDGSADAATICADLGLTEAQLWQAIHILDRCGLLDEPGGSPLAAPEVLDYFSRTHRASGGYRSGLELLDALATAGVAVIGPVWFGLALAEDLRASGVGEVITAEVLTTAVLTGIGRCDRRLVIAWDDPAWPDLLSGTVTRCTSAGIQVLRVAAGDEAVEIGPRFWPPYAACVSCLRRGRDDLDWSTGPMPDDAAESLAVGLVAAEVLSTLARIDLVPTPRQLTRIQLSTLVTERFLVAPYPGCPSCVALVPGVGESVSAAAAYEWQMEWLHADLDSRRPEPPGEAERIDGLQTARTLLDYLPGVPLPPDLGMPPSRLVFGETGGRTPLTVELLATLLVRTAGFREDRGTTAVVRRWAPSGGNLASVECYVVTNQRFVALPGTVFRYDDLAHRLCTVHADPVPVADVLADTDLDAADHDTVLLLVAGVRRLADKYGRFAARLAHLDAGCAVVQLLAVATAYGLPSRLASTWGGEPARLLELVPGEEVVTAIVGLGRNGER
jgi:SagB-type dehydrogenase family enzyme